MTKEDFNQLKNIVLERQKDSIVERFEKSDEWIDNKEELINHSLHGKNVLVVGSEAVLKQDFTPDVKDYELLNRSGGDSEQLLFELLKRGENSRLYEGYSCFAEAQEVSSLFQDIRAILKERNGEWRDRAIDMIDPSLRLLLESKCFRLVITTCIDPILEYALQKIWGEELKIKNIHDDANPYNQDIMTEENRKSEFYDINPTLYYAFGKAAAGGNKMYAITDDRKVYTIDCWLAARKPINLLQYILNKDVMAVGCKFENWVFRFFWYLLGQKPSLPSSPAFYESSCKKGSVAIMLSDNNIDEEKTKFFINKKQINYFEDSRAFMTLLAPELVKDTPPQSGDFFISYASEDFATANIIYEFLSSQRQKVWFDIRLKAGDWFNDEISKGIEQCNVFMPILSNQTKRDLESHKSRYYRKEWEKADEKMKRGDNDFLIFPIVIEEYSVKENYHSAENVTDSIKNTTCFSAQVNASLIHLSDEIDEQRRKMKERKSQNVKTR